MTLAARTDLVAKMSPDKLQQRRFSAALRPTIAAQSPLFSRALSSKQVGRPGAGGRRGESFQQAVGAKMSRAGLRSTGFRRQFRLGLSDVRPVFHLLSLTGRFRCRDLAQVRTRALA
ncbi:MAG: hypothetical protein ACLR9W_10830 [Enterobacter hormaechei]